jgi:hypothetical protein
MPKFKKTQNSFNSGEISSDFFGHDIDGAVSKMENISVSETGVLTRRPGTIRVDSLTDENNIIISFDNEYLLVLSEEKLIIYKDNTFYQSFLLDWNIDEIKKIQWVQRFDTMIFVHPNNEPKVLQKKGNIFSFTAFLFDRDSENFPILPFMRFNETENISFTLSSHPNGTNWAKITASAAIWDTAYIGTFLMFLNKKWQIQTYISSTQVVVSTTTSFTMPTVPVRDWKEAAFSNKRGWPRSITFHQDRLVFGGSRDWPCGLWLSKTGYHHNFDAGTGLDDEAIFITLLSEIQQKICNCISSRDLQILTDAGEWTISSIPLTPSTINIRQHTSIGTSADIFVPPQKFSGNTIFVSGNNIIEFALDELGENYNANNLTLLSKHIINSPVSMTYGKNYCQLFVVMQNGKMAVLTKEPAARISAWANYTTNGQYKSVASHNNNIYVIVERESNTYLEMFSKDAILDSGEFDFEWIVSGTPLKIEKHNPDKTRINHISVMALNIRHIKILEQDFYFDSPFSGNVIANCLGTTTNSFAPLWKISSHTQTNAQVLSVSVDGSYEI